MDVYYKERYNCVVCDYKMSAVVHLPNFPLTDMVFSKPEVGVLNQSLLVCESCGHVQLSNIIYSDILYSNDYSFLTSVGMSTKINDKLYEFIVENVGIEFNTIIEIGCNDCYLLSRFKNAGSKNLIGIDPILSGREDKYKDSGIAVFGKYFEDYDLGRQHNSLIVSSHVLEHLDNPRKTLEKIINSVDDSSVMVFQFPCFDILLEGFRFDQVYNHHLHYFSFASFERLINSLGCYIIASQVDYNYWGTFTVAFSKRWPKVYSVYPLIYPNNIISKYNTFKTVMLGVEAYLRDCNDLMFGYGASLQVSVLDYHLNWQLSKNIDCIVDDSINKQGKYLINFPVKIVSIDEVNIRDSVVIVTAVNFSREIVKKLSFLPKKIIVPFGVV